MNISEQIKKHRDKNNVSQEELAEILFVSRQTISNWETEKTYPDLRSLLMLSDYFKISLDELVKGDLSMMKQKNSAHYLNNWSISAFGSLIVVLLGGWVILNQEIKLIYATPIILLSMFSAFAFYKVEKIKGNEYIQTFKEITAYMESRSLGDVEKKIEVKSRQKKSIKSKIYKVLSGAAIAVVILLLLELISKI